MPRDLSILLDPISPNLQPGLGSDCLVLLIVPPPLGEPRSSSEGLSADFWVPLEPSPTLVTAAAQCSRGSVCRCLGGAKTHLAAMRSRDEGGHQPATDAAHPSYGERHGARDPLGTSAAKVQRGRTAC